MVTNLGLASNSLSHFDDLVSVIVQTIAPKQIYLFGSKARGTAHANSDTDVLIVQDQPMLTAQARYQQERALYRAFLQRHFGPVDVLVFSPPEIEQWQQSQNHVIGHALREGKKLYERE